MPSDPLEGIEQYPPKTQMALVVQELRSQRNLLLQVARRDWWILTTLVGLLIVIIGGLSLFIVTGGKP